jgi:Zn-dependent protease with chaperone function/pimeloyl-ACP methyl ester carboxylesterase
MIPFLAASFLGMPGLLPAAEPVAYKELTPEVRSRIDRFADESPLETRSQEQVNFGGNIVAWQISQTTLTPAEEFAAAKEQHQKLAKRVRMLPPPDDVQKIFDRLVEELPPRMRPEAFRFTVTVLDIDEINAFTVGGGFVYLSRPLVEQLQAGGDRGKAALALVIGHELGHVSLQHCRRGYQLQRLMEHADQLAAAKVSQEQLKLILRTSIAATGHMSVFLFSREQEYEADLFGLHLSRNAGIDSNDSLDLFRWFTLMQHPRLRDTAERPKTADTPSTLLYYLSSHPSSACRLRRLRMELAGQVENEAEFGLFLFDRKTGKYVKAAAQSVEADRPAIVFIHGLRGDRDTFSPLVDRLREQSEADHHQFLAFRYPNNGSLARAGLFLHREMARVVASPERTVFVCHSAGGLVFRYYAERKQGAFARAVFLGTPHAGSDMIRLKALLDTAEFVMVLKQGLPDAIATTVAEGKGDIALDLQSDSLFLRYLGQDKERVGRYVVYSGEVMNVAEAFVLRRTLNSSKETMRKRVNEAGLPASMRDGALAAIENLELPDEIASGDGIVTLRSAALPGVDRPRVCKRLNHMTLKSDPKILVEIVRSILKE